MKKFDKLKELLKNDIKTNNIDLELPIFSQRKKLERDKDKYENDPLILEKFVGIFSYGHKILGKGETEGLFRTINSYILNYFSKDDSFNLLDVGCGVGRTLYDCGEYFPKAYFVGLDYSYCMAKKAKEIINDGKIIPVDLTALGYKKYELEGKSLNNVMIVQGNACKLPFRDETFDAVINTYLIDRLSEPIIGINEMCRVLKPNGLFVLSNPLNYLNKEFWDELQTKEQIKSVLEVSGILIDEIFDGLPYHQLEDVRGNFKIWKTLFIKGIKKSSKIV